MCPVIWDIQNHQIHRDKLYITGYQGLGKGKREHTVYWTQNFSLEVTSEFQARDDGGLYQDDRQGDRSLKS